MKKSWVVVAAVAAGTAVVLVCLMLPVTGSNAAPAPAGGAAEKWEYAELHYTQSLSFPARNAPGGFAPAGGRGGGGGGGAAQPGGRGVGQPARTVKTTVSWVTADAETETSSWEELAKKLKAPAAKKGAPKSADRLRVLNRLGADGWELVSCQGAGFAAREGGFASGNNSVWFFKRKIK